MRSAIYTAETATTAGIVNGGTLPIGSVSKRTGCGLSLNGRSINIHEAGMYQVVANFTVAPSANDRFTIRAMKDGVAIPGAETTFSAAAAVTMPIAFLVKHVCCKDSCNIYFDISSVTASTTFTLSSAAVTAVKLV